jgi:hypothetical protein
MGAENAVNGLRAYSQFPQEARKHTRQVSRAVKVRRGIYTKSDKGTRYSEESGSKITNEFRRIHNSTDEEKARLKIMRRISTAKGPLEILHYA